MEDTWYDSLPPGQRPAGVVAGVLSTRRPLGYKSTRSAWPQARGLHPAPHLADHARAAHRHPGDLAAAHRHGQWEAVLPPRCRDPGGLPRLRAGHPVAGRRTTCGNR